jgi:ribose-phosphate pyrophosphokinase
VTPRFYALSDSLELGKATAQEAGIELSALEERNFESGEFRIRPLTSVRDRPAYVLQTLAGSLTARGTHMRTIVLFTLVAINLASLGACSTIGPTRLGEPYRTSRCAPTSDCSPMEEFQ